MSNLINAVGMDTTTGQFNIADPDDTAQVPSLVSNSPVPTLVVGTAAGTGAIASIIGTNLAGKVTLNAGTIGLTSGTVLTMTFANSFAYPTGCAVTFAAGNAAFAAVVSTIYATTNTTTVVLSVTAGLTLSTTYIGYYQVIGW